MTEIAVQSGFILRNTCNCSGCLTKNYNKTVDGKLFELKIRPTRNNWVLKLRNTVIAKGGESTLLTKLKEHEVIR